MTGMSCDYIMEALDKAAMNGDAYMCLQDLYQSCVKKRAGLSWSVFRGNFEEARGYHLIVQECNRVYLSRNRKMEKLAAEELARILPNNEIPAPDCELKLRLLEKNLCPEQVEAVRMVIHHKLSLILGGAGTGKTTLIPAILNVLSESIRGSVFCAPTGKAARNLTERTGIQARTVHSALGLTPEDDVLEAVQWNGVDLVIVDEGSMLTTELLAGLLQNCNPGTRLVILGDPNQLQAVGAGNVIPDLINLNFPTMILRDNHRQRQNNSALLNNVVHFSEINELEFDDSFSVEGLARYQAHQKLVEEAVRLYSAGKSVQVLSPINENSIMSVSSLNRDIQARLNPSNGKKCIKYRTAVFVDGDRVMITKNDRKRDCCNGDVGILRILDDNPDNILFSVSLPGSRAPRWTQLSDLQYLTLAYALTVHKSQGSEYDTIILPLDWSLNSAMNRNMLYTAVSRARNRVIMYGDASVLPMALRKRPHSRASMLTQRTRQHIDHAA